MAGSRNLATTRGGRRGATADTQHRRMVPRDHEQRRHRIDTLELPPLAHPEREQPCVPSEVPLLPPECRRVIQQQALQDRRDAVHAALGGDLDDELRVVDSHAGVGIAERPPGPGVDISVREAGPRRKVRGRRRPRPAVDMAVGKDDGYAAAEHHVEDASRRRSVPPEARAKDAVPDVYLHGHPGERAVPALPDGALPKVPVGTLRERHSVVRPAGDLRREDRGEGDFLVPEELFDAAAAATEETVRLVLGVHAGEGPASVVSLPPLLDREPRLPRRREEEEVIRTGHPVGVPPQHVEAPVGPGTGDVRAVRVRYHLDGRVGCVVSPEGTIVVGEEPGDDSVGVAVESTRAVLRPVRVGGGVAYAFFTKTYRLPVAIADGMTWKGLVWVLINRFIQWVQSVPGV
ncbi:hypothetical protein THAOC_14722 [Thalassiosira oceanica]|uniref:Uncharacterized protein n=1 Tax=Thalassiosira oceanica TaxID=159749 RepID=K0T237_THAOC|nr:hypothetical protein THAOC_14722 [Thalassiosira oceanica]|eukprot:EJK64537.1 hypothetical protein THAOC_14722 [Thalassiosira oceanica]